MKILHLISQRPECTGSGFYLQAVLRHTAGAGHENFLLAGITRGCEPELPVIDGNKCRYVVFGQENLPFEIPGMSDVMPYPSSVFGDLTETEILMYEKRFQEEISKAVDYFRPDLIHSHHMWIMTSIARRLYPDIPMVVNCHGTDLRQFRNCPGLGDRVRESCRSVESVMCLSQAQKSDVIEMFGIQEERAHVVGSGFDHELFYPGNPEAKDSTPQIMYAGKLSRAKGALWLLESLERIKDLNWHLHLAGSGTGKERDECLELAGKLGGRVTVYGAVSQEFLANLMRRSHVFVLPSFFEGLPLVLLEAVRSGCRVITTSLPGSREVFHGVREDLVRFIELPRLQTVDSPYSSDMPGLVDDLSGALTDEIQAAGRGEHPDIGKSMKITDPFTWEEVCRRIEKIYQFSI